MTERTNDKGENPAAVASDLSDLERELLLGESKGWGSWMFSVGSDLCAKGLGSKRNGSIYFDTPLAKQVVACLRTPTPTEHSRG